MKDVQEGGGGQLCQKLLIGQIRWGLKTIIFRNDVDIGDPEESNFGGILWGKG